MSMSDPIADLLTRIRNAIQARHETVVVPRSKLKLEVVKEIHLPLYVTEFNVSTLQANLDILVRQKLTKPFDINAMIWKP